MSAQRDTVRLSVRLSHADASVKLATRSSTCQRFAAA